LLRLDLDAGNAGIDEAPVLDLVRRLEMVANRLDDQCLDLGGRDPA
jgi:hypothetical protein